MPAPGTWLNTLTCATAPVRADHHVRAPTRARRALAEVWAVKTGRPTCRRPERSCVAA